MSFLVLSYPELSPGDHAWIQSIRAEHDAQYEVVGPHFTFVFPASRLNQETFVAHARNQARGQAKFSFVLRCAVVVTDTLSAHTHVCLVPDGGHRTMVELHDRLYTGPLAAELRLDIPFIPHLTVGNAVEAQACKRLADDLNAQSFVILGEITILDVVRYDEGRLESIERIELAHIAKSEIRRNP
jgi:2'-5' RNA ligase